MEASSRSFLFEEYRALWHHIEHLDSIRTKAVLLYLAGLGAVLGSVAGIALRNPPQPTTGLFDVLTTLPSAVMFSALFFSLVTSFAVLSLWIQFRSLFVEYTYSLNMIRRAFEREDQALHSFLVLPTRMADVRPGTHGAARDIYLFLCAVSASFVWLSATAVFYRSGFHGWGVPAAAMVLSAAWILFFYRWYRRDVQTTLDNLWTRCEKTAVNEEIAMRAHELSQISGSEATANWLVAEAEVKARWGQSIGCRP